MDLKTSVDEVLRKIGRNMLLFQQLEGLLKFTLSGNKLSGVSSQLERKQAKHVASTQKQTLGILVGQYVEEILGPETDDEGPDLDKITEPHFSYKFRLGHNEAFYEEIKTWLAQLVDDRNELVHHLLPQLDTTSAASCEETGQKLDIQADTIRQAIRNMQSIAKAMTETKKEVVALLQSLEGKSMLFPDEQPKTSALNK
ncbi:hypothetical protein SH580_07410 [Coraliomargarita algicola]|uniref:Uncharacterized protein n=1 Tax=Coraliomargarita algicola TaxID=3092156 RepID=A0ABZ0RQZ8_9BACT|nr:hypothetical protein [Coraliomargarita sp. J2-16]WPJ97536.1 hypothetical protein SH580_07410 [Coraliomargarita sp. J2-16]